MRTLLLVSCLGLASCRDDAPASNPRAQTPVQVGAELNSVMQRVHFAWRAQGLGYAAGHTTHLLRATNEAIEFTPVAPAVTGFVQGTPLQLKSSKVTWGGVRSSRAAWQTDDEGQLVSTVGGVTERLRNFEDGVEQTWRFERALSSTGDLEVKVPVAGAHLLETTAGGLHFEAGELRVRYGQATWVDAAGTRTPVRTRWDAKASTIVLRVPAQVLAASRYPATLDPVISAEMSSDAPVPGTPLNTTGNAVAGSNGSTFLVAWTDARLGRSGSTDIWAARVNASGVVLDSTGVLVASLGADRRLTVGGVAFDGINFVVAYRSQGATGLGDIYASRVTVAGAALDPTGIAISTDPADQTSPAIACGTGSCLLAWADYRVASDKPTVIGARVSGTTVQDANGLAISSGTVWATDPSIAYDGTNYLVVWADGRVGGAVTDLYGARVSAAGAVIDPNTSINSAVKSQTNPRVTWAGTKYFVVWADRRNDSADVLADIYGATIGIASGLQVSSDFAVSTAAAAEAAPTVSWDGANALVAWQNQTTNHIMAARVSLAGTVVTTGFTASRVDHLQQGPFVAFNGTNHLLGWSDTTLGSVAAVRVNPSATVLDSPELAVSIAGNTQLTPAIAVGGGGYFVVWADNRNPATGADIWGARFNLTGTLLDPTGIAISTATGNQTSPAIAWNGAAYLAVWVDQRSDPKGDIYGTRIDGSGVVQDPSGLALNVDTNGQRQPAVSGAFNGSTFIVAWSDDRNLATTGWDIYGARVSSAGVVTTFPIGTQLGEASWPALATDATDYLAAWAEDTTVRGVRVRGVGGTTGSMQDYGQGGYVHPQHVALAFGLVHTNTYGYLVGWDDPYVANGANLYFKATNLFGLSDGPNTIYGLTTPPPGRGRLALTYYSSATYLAVWTGQQTVATTDYDIVAGRVITPNSPTSGGFLSFPDGDGFVVAGGVNAESWPAAIFSNAKQLLVAYQGFDARAAVQAPRIFVRPVLLDDLPTANAQAVTTAEDTSKAITLTGTAPAGDTIISYTVATQPAHGTLSGTPPNLTYTPATNYNGPDSFTFTVKDEWIDSLPGTVTISVTPVNDKPIANDHAVTTAQNTSLGITLTASDVDGDTLTYTVVSPPAHGTLTGTVPNLTFTPTTNYNGPDSLVFRVNDGTVDSATATISITVSMVNQRPVATPQSASTAEDVQLNLTLTGTDVEPGTLIFTIVSPPSHGTLTGSPPGVTYTPAANYNGLDSFTFKVNDGNLDSLTPATVSLTITPVNDQPTVNSQTPTVAEDTTLNVTLTGSDVESSPLTFSVVTLPTHGTLTGTPPTLTYTPAPNYNGPDSFTFKANDGSLDSAPGTIGITVSAVNDAPVALAQAVSTAEDTQLTVTVAGTDVDGNSLTYAVVNQPAHGTLSGTPPTLTYQPAANYNGADSFTFRANDGTLDSALATVSITITPVNDAPQASAQSVTTTEDTAIAVTLAATDVEGSPLTYVVGTGPAHGSLAGTPPSLTYTPNSNYSGADSFTFKANDGTVDSAPATVSITVTPVNDAPIATPQSLSTAEDNQLAVLLTGTDVESSALTFTVVAAPGHGTLSGSPPNLTYSPAANYNGPDSFTFKANDGTLDSAVATISITVTPVNDAPNAVPQTISVPENSTVPITLVGTDVDSTTLTYSLVSVPAHGTLTGTPPNVVYSPATNFSGADSFAFKVNDGSVDSGLATIAITVSGVNTAPVGIAQTVSVPEDTPVAITVAATDAEGNLLSFAAVAHPRRVDGHRAELHLHACAQLQRA